jgi:hypothetical protein
MFAYVDSTLRGKRLDFRKLNVRNEQHAADVEKAPARL